ncbi:hypothetical protein T07_9674 [Trichinella nelsoni]|uniref:Uncharacterized protein n=1 Tax=Trichinella nelsoni TaxID=6336 RepID=A0A0V0RXI4_9BILA|nr:hypothetical protein T07_9674 [Trichinella nelsoni]
MKTFHSVHSAMLIITNVRLERFSHDSSDRFVVPVTQALAWSQYANFLCPQATPQAMPQAFSQKFRFFKNLALGVAPGYASGHKKICIFPQAMP